MESPFILRYADFDASPALLQFLIPPFPSTRFACFSRPMVLRDSPRHRVIASCKPASDHPRRYS